jgi:hypothetical protein
MVMAVGKIGWFFVVLTLLGLLACGSQSEQPVPSSSTPVSLLRESQPLAGSFEDLELTTGQTIFVPAYAGLYKSAQYIINLDTTISIHNTDLQDPLIIHSVQYYGGNGKLIKDYVPTPVRLAPMATTTFFVDRAQPQEGLGANFIIKWAAEKKVYEPVVEAVMIGSLGTHGFSFISPGRVLSQK